MGVKSRRPYHLPDDDFDTFCYVDTKGFMAGVNSLPNRPTHLVASQSALADNFHAKLDVYNAAKTVRDNATSAFDEAATAIREKLRWMQLALPGLTPGSSAILVPFGLDVDVPADNDSMKNFADSVFAHWVAVRLEPLFLPFQANIDALAPIFTAYEIAQTNQNIAQQAASLLQNEKDAIRKQCEAVLMAIIDWYRIYYKNPLDDYWTQTPFGKSSGEGEGAIGVPENLVSEIIGADVRLVWDIVEGAEAYQLSHTMHPPLFLQLFEGDATVFLHTGPDDGVHYYRVRAKVGETYGEFSEQIEVDVKVEKPAAPINLVLSQNIDNSTKATWESAPGVVYDGCSIYYVDVPTGDPEPSMPTAPYFDELIVYTFTLPVLASGKTRYVWVTGTKDGAESDPCGPVNIAIM